MKNINVVLFDNFTIMDVFGPVEVFCRLEKYFKIDFFSKGEMDCFVTRRYKAKE